MQYNWSCINNCGSVCISMSEVTLYYLLVIVGIFLSSCSQLLLKKSADKDKGSLIKSVLNWRVIVSYSVLFLSLFINITAMGKGVRLKDMPVLESLGYVFVPFLSLFFLSEKLTFRSYVSILFIIIGIIIFYY